MRYLLIILSFCTLIFSYTQEDIDVLYLNNGDIIKGKIIENSINDYVKVELKGGSILTYKYSEIKNIKKEKTLNLDITEKIQPPYDNLLGVLYLNVNGNGVYAVNSMRRLKNSDILNIGFLFATNYVDNNYPGQSYLYVPYLAFDLFKLGDNIVPYGILGGKLSVRNWIASGGINGTVTHFGLAFGGGINVKLTKKIGLGLIGVMAENFYFIPYTDGSADITSTEYKFYPALTLNFYDIF